MSTAVFDATRPPVWSPFVTLDVEVASPWATTHPAGLWHQSRWGQPAAVWSGMEPNWASIRCDVTGWKMERGRAGSLDRVPTSTSSITAQNNTGWSSWSPDPDPEVSLGLRPGRSIRVTAERNGAAKVLWTGWLQNAHEKYPPAGGGPPTVDLAAVDGLSRLALVDPLEQAPVGAGDTVDARLARLCTVAGWPLSRTSFAPSTTTVQATTLARNLLDDAQVTTESDGGMLYGDLEGGISSKARDWLRIDPKALAVQATFSNTGVGFCPAGFVVDGPDVSTVQNRIIVSRAGGNARQYDDLDSQSLYGIRTYRRLDYICTGDDMVELLGQRRLTLAAEPSRRLRAIEIDPLADEGLWDFILAVDYGWRLHVDYQHPTEGWGWAGDVHVHGIGHAVTPDGWRTTLRVEDASYWKAGSGWNRDLWHRGRWTTAPTRSRTGGLSAWH